MAKPAAVPHSKHRSPRLSRPDSTSSKSVSGIEAAMQLPYRASEHRSWEGLKASKWRSKLRPALEAWCGMTASSWGSLMPDSEKKTLEEGGDGPRGQVK